MSLRLVDADAMKASIFLRQLRQEVVERRKQLGLQAGSRSASSSQGVGTQADAGSSTPALSGGLIIVTQFVDVHTRRLLQRQPDLLEPLAAPQLREDAEAEGQGGSGVEAIVFRRNKIESAVLVSAAHSDASWSSLNSLLDPTVDAELQIIQIQDLFGSNPQTQRATGGRQSVVLARYSFQQLYDLLQWLGKNQ